MMNYNKKIFFIIFVTALVIVFSILVATTLRPNQKTPLSSLVTQADDSGSISGAPTIAAWVWQSPEEMESNIDSIMSFAKKEGINNLYIYVDEYIDIYEMPQGSQREARMSAFQNALKDVVQRAKENNISIHALSGAPSYSYDSHSYIPPILVSYIFQFNQENPDLKISGIQFDIEFYDDPRFFGSVKEYTDDYIKLVSDLSKMTSRLNLQYNDNVRLGFVIPFWFDQSNQYFDSPILGSVLNALSSTSNPYLIIMAYRNFVNGQGGALDVSRTELQQASSTHVKIIIGQEVVQNKDTKITLFGDSKKEIKEHLAQIIDGAKSYPSFEGVTIHDLNAFMKVE